MKNRLMIYRFVILAVLGMSCFQVTAQASFIEGTSTVFRQGAKSGVATGIVDVDGDLRDDLVFADNGGQLTVLTFRGDGLPFEAYYTSPDLGVGTWSLVVGDVDQNGFVDIIQADGTRVLLHSQVSAAVFELSTIYSPSWLPQAANLADFDADGDLDYFLCNDDGLNLLLENDGTGAFSESTAIDFTTTPESDNSGNYSSIWTDIDNDGDRDLYIAKCRAGVTDPSDPRRINALYINEGNGQWVERAAEYGVADGSQTWSVDADDVDNDGDQDLFLTNHDAPHRLLLNEGTSFVEYEYLAEPYESFAFQGVFYDMDNNGWLDIVVTDGSSNMVLYNEGMSFTQEEWQPFATKARSAIVGDINNDGFGDIWAQYNTTFTGSPNNSKVDGVYLNTGNANNYLKFVLTDPERQTAEAAKMTISGSWGSMVREVKLGTSYGQTMSEQVHFGLGQQSEVASAVISWADGAVQELEVPLLINSTYHIVKSGCVTRMENPSLENNGYLCEGQTIEVTAQTQQVVQWSTGIESTSTPISQTGSVDYSYIDSVGCEVRSFYAVVQAESSLYQDPLITAQYLNSCVDNPPLLQATVGQSYSWSNGAEEQLIAATASGDYIVTITSFCGDTYVSDSIEILLVEVQEPVVQNDSVNLGEDAVLLADSETAKWFETPTSSFPVHIGSQLELEELNESVTYFVEQDSQTYLSKRQVGLLTPDTEDKYASNTLSGGLFFIVTQPVRLTSFFVETDLPGVRRVVIEEDGVVIWSSDYNLTTGGQRLTVGVELPLGFYLLRTDDLVNLENLGHQGPRLARTQGEDVLYPYQIEAVRIVASTNGLSRYFYFYDWEVSTDFVSCVSNRAEALAYVRPLDTKEEVLTERGQIYPNPTVNSLQVIAASPIAFVEVSNMAGQILLKQEVSDIQTVVNTQGFESGMYIVSINYVSGGKELHKMLKIK